MRKIKLYKLTTLILSTIIITSCSSVQLPTVEESTKAIEQFKAQVEQEEQAIKSKNILLPDGKDFIMRANIDAMNKIR